MDCEWDKLNVTLSPEILKTLEELKFSNTTPVQVNFSKIIVINNKIHTKIFLNLKRFSLQPYETMGIFLQCSDCLSL